MVNLSGEVASGASQPTGSASGTSNTNAAAACVCLTRARDRNYVEVVDLTFVSFCGEPLDMIHSFETWLDGRELLRVVAHRLKKGIATMALSNGTEPLRSEYPLSEQGINTDTNLTVTYLLEPRAHDGIQECDTCGFLRFCHFGYAWAPAIQEYDAVLSVCEPCGGRPHPAVLG